MTAPTAPVRSERRRASRIWHLVIAIDVTVALIIQVWLILTGGPDPNTGETVATVGVLTRMIQTVSFFTIQSNILVLVVAITMIIDPDRDGRFWRVLRLDALLGITITGLVFDLILIRYVDPHGWQLVATIGFHYIAPWATLLGWLLFGPRPRIDRGTLIWVWVWPLAWIAYTFIRGAIVDWYPYPFLDVEELGYAASLRNTGFVLLVAVVLVVVFTAIDRRLGVVGGGRRQSDRAVPSGATAAEPPAR
ncbi:Pr6Pr family membrane protein [Nakamurella leprariae]|uniref:Pr6Pr family membrane protein n=1 Tax=Nakamurella leprariae TaxID=2803911 RepID=A0A938YGZ1_9ACTN|nr:Pr6Pr family membrane protein [Nakamurella leprariae]MBM9467924.1 Pr6Pr family membrane protein [Nakamurella leprariae]